MEVIANGFMIMATITAMAAVIMGAIGGSIVWRVKSGLALGSLSTMGLYLLPAVAFLGFPWVAVVVFFGIPPLMLTFLTSFLAGHHLDARANLPPIWATLAALGSALTAGALYLLLFRFSMQASIWVTLGAVVCLILIAFKNRKVAPR